MKMEKEKMFLILSYVSGFTVFFFTRTSTYIPFAVVIASLFILSFLRRQKRAKGIWLALAGFFLSNQLSLWRLFDLKIETLTMAYDLVRNVVLAVVLFLPYAVDRFFHKRIRGYAGSLVFPTAATALYYLVATFGPFKGTGIFFAYTNYGSVFAQILSFVGIWGSVFVCSWLASSLLWIREERFQWERVKKGTMVTGGIVLGLFLFGGIKASPLFYDYEGKTVRVAAVVYQDRENTLYSLPDRFNERRFSNLEEALSGMKDRIRTASIAGAKIICFQEYALILQEKDEPFVLKRLGEIARENQVYLILDYVSFPPLQEGEHPIDFLGNTILDDEQEEGFNKAVLINPEGQSEMEYHKRHLGFGESVWIRDSQDNISVAETPYGRIGLVICRDMEFPGFMRQASRQSADIVFAPSYENVKLLAVTYSQMMRAVENGFSFVRPVSHGLSVAVDYNGNILSSMNYFTTGNEILLADVPVAGRATLYRYIGDAVAWLSICGLVFLILFGFIKKDAGK